VIFAIFWVGGMLFLPLVLLPSIKDNPQRREILIKSGLKFRYYGWIALLGLFLTGISNMHFKGLSFSTTSLFHTELGKMLLWKLIIFFLMVIFLLIHDVYIGRKFMQENTSNNERLRKVAGYTGRINLILSLLLVLLGVFISRGIII
jgi:putative copper export protein